ncbi:MAG: hypothetical protein ABTQ34_04330 [Bdellovibrionales bacterium]
MLNVKKLIKTAGRAVLLHSGQGVFACAVCVFPAPLGEAYQEQKRDLFTPEERRHPFDPRDESDEGKMRIAKALRREGGSIYQNLTVYGISI